MMAKRFMHILARSVDLEGRRTNIDEGRVSIQHYRVIGSFVKGLMLMVAESDSQDYAMSVILKGQDSARQYVEDKSWPLKSANLLMSHDHVRHLIENDYSIEATLAQ